MPGLLKVLLLALAIPAVGFGVSSGILFDMSKPLKAQGLPDVVVLCDVVRSGLLSEELATDLRGACQEVANVVLLRRGSILAAAVGMLILVMYWLASIFAGKNRRRIAFIFPLVLRLSLILIAASVLLQGAILTYAAYIGESYAIGRVHIFIIGGIGLGALLGALKLIGAAMSFGGKLQMIAIGKVLNVTDSPQLFHFVQSLTKKLDAIMPQNIIVGLEPTFYVTNCDILIPGDETQITGETLYLSAPLARVLSKEEFASVVGHELGHFRGDDTIYSMRFAPVYAGLGRALGAIATDEEEGASGLAKYPAMAMLAYMYGLFATKVAKISRDREHKADTAGAEAGSALGLSTALVKVLLYSNLWNHARQQNIDRLNQGKVSTNLSIVFEDVARYDVDHDSIEQIMKATLEESISHPTDSHPPLSKRLRELGINARQLTKDMLLIPKNAAIQLLEKPEKIEEELTLLEHKVMVAHGAAKLPEEADRNYLLHATYSLAAAIVAADGAIDPGAMAIAEGLGKKFFEDFDSVEFREHCKTPGDTSEVLKVSEAMREVLEDDIKHLMITYLGAIAEANDGVSEEKRVLLQKLSAVFGISQS